MLIDSTVIRLIKNGSDDDPSYTVTIHGKGTVVYKGIDNVGTEGFVEEKFDEDKIISLLTEFKKSDFFSIEDDFNVDKSADRSYTTLSLNITDEQGSEISKSITYYDDTVTDNLKSLESSFKEIIGANKWIEKPAIIKDKPKKEKEKKTVEEKKPKEWKNASSKKPIKIISAVIIVIIAIVLVVASISLGIINIDSTESANNNNETHDPGNGDADPGSVDVLISANVTSGYAPLSVSFTSTVQNFPEETLFYEWDFKDGSKLYSENANHVFLSPGTYLVTLTVTDYGNNEASDSITIVVSETTSNMLTAKIISATAMGAYVLDYIGTATGGTGNYQYTWEFYNSEDELLATSLASYGSVVFESMGLIRIIFKVNDGINSDTSTEFEFVS